MDAMTAHAVDFKVGMERASLMDTLKNILDQYPDDNQIIKVLTTPFDIHATLILSENMSRHRALFLACALCLCLICPLTLFRS